MNTFNLKLDIDKSSRGFRNPVVRLRQADKNGTTIVAQLYDHGEPLTTSGLSAAFEMLQPDRQHYYRKVADYDDGTVSITLDESYAASVPGETDQAYFRLYDGADVIASTEPFRLSVLRSALQDAEPPEDFDDIVVAMTKATTIEWLEDHPEATTTVQDDSLTTAKYKDGSVTLPKLGSDAVGAIRSNRLRGTRSGAVVTAADAYAAPPLELVVDGKSVQDGTPTPSSPVAIDSVESVAVALGEPHAVPADAIENGEIAGNGTESDNTKRCRTKSSVTFTPNGHVRIKVTGNTSASGFLQYAVNCKMPDGTYQNAVNVWTQVGESLAFPSGTVSFRLCFKTSTNATISPSSLSDIAYTLFDATTIDLDGHALRSLPDGTHDELTVDADGNVTLVQRVGTHIYTGGENWSVHGSIASWFYLDTVTLPSGDYSKGNDSAAGISDKFTAVAYSSVGSLTNGQFAFGIVAASQARRIVFKQTGVTTVADFKAWLAQNNITVHYPLLNPVTHDLGTVTLPATPAPDLTAWAVTDPSTAIALDYERDLTIAITAIESAIADLATS